MYQQRYFAPKYTGTLTDTLAAYGLAALLQELARQQKSAQAGVRVWIRDTGAAYEVALDEPVREEWVSQGKFFSLVPFVQTAKAPADAIAHFHDYDTVWRGFQTFQTALKEQRTLAQAQGRSMTDAAQAVADRRPGPEFWPATLIGERRMQVLSIHNLLVRQWWATREQFPINLRTVLEVSAVPETDLDAIARRWLRAMRAAGAALDKLGTDVTCSQLFNPHQGKGQNRAKANALAMENERSFWLLEYLKAAGFWHCAAPRRVRDSDDRKTYVLAPLRLTLGAHSQVFDKFISRLWSETSVKMDAVAALLYAQCLLEYSEAGQFDELELENTAPERVVAGFHVAEYKLLSRNAYTMMHLGFLGLPTWTGNVRSPERLRTLRAIIDEHLAVVRGINEEHSDGYDLLLKYRDFLSGRRWDSFFDFTGSYAEYLMRVLDEARRTARLPAARAFTINNLEALIMGTNTDLLPIVQNLGFQNVARAIRQSTISLQYMNIGHEQRREAREPYEVRYGLADSLRRKAHNKLEFASVLTEFAQLYNAENARVAEQTNGRARWRRQNITTEDLQQVIALLDQFSPELICNLVVAFGYARDPRADQTTNSGTAEGAPEPAEAAEEPATA